MINDECTRLEPIKNNLPGCSGWNRLYPLGKHCMVSCYMRAFLFKYLLESLWLQKSKHTGYTVYFLVAVAKHPTQPLKKGQVYYGSWFEGIQSIMAGKAPWQNGGCEGGRTLTPFALSQKQRGMYVGAQLTFFYCFTEFRPQCIGYITGMLQLGLLLTLNAIKLTLKINHHIGQPTQSSLPAGPSSNPENSSSTLFWAT